MCQDGLRAAAEDERRLKLSAGNHWQLGVWELHCHLFTGFLSLSRRASPSPPSVPSSPPPRNSPSPPSPDLPASAAVPTPQTPVRRPCCNRPRGAAGHTSHSRP